MHACTRPAMQNAAALALLAALSGGTALASGGAGGPGAATGLGDSGDGRASDRAFIRLLQDRFGSLALTDVDGDGDVDDRDAVLILARAIDSLAGRSGDPPSDEAVQTAEEIVRGVSADETENPWEFHAQWITRQYHDQTSSNETRPPGYPPNHDRNLTNQWYQPPSTHQKSTSGDNWPPSHLYDVTKTWTPDVHDVKQSKHRWPPNHLQDVSVEWPMQTPNSHDVVTSRTWPPNHRLADSRNMFPQHYQPISTFDPNSIVPRWNHEQFFTSQWTHETNLSRARWPGSHYFQISLTWPQSHSMRLSVHWPAGHWAQSSQLWTPEGEPPRYPQDWPPNHSFTISKKWGQPPKLPPWFPGPDHSLWQSARDIVPVIVVPGEEGKATPSQEGAPGGASQQE